MRENKTFRGDMAKIPKDHRGLYACEPFNHGVETKLFPQNEEERMFMNGVFGKFSNGKKRGE